MPAVAGNLQQRKNFLTPRMAEALRAATRGALRRHRDWEYYTTNGDPDDFSTETYKLEECGYIVLDYAGGAAPTKSGQYALNHWSNLLEGAGSPENVPYVEGIPHIMKVANR